MLIYRIESSVSHKGVYSIGLGYSCHRDVFMGVDGNLREYHPCPTEDEMMSDRWNGMDPDERQQFVFGFNSIKQLHRWFPVRGLQKMVEMIEEGKRYNWDSAHAVIAIYEVPDEHVIIGRTQAVFRRPQATLVRNVPVDYFNNLG